MASSAQPSLASQATSYRPSAFGLRWSSAAWDGLNCASAEEASLLIYYITLASIFSQQMALIRNKAMDKAFSVWEQGIKANQGQPAKCACTKSDEAQSPMATSFAC